MCPSSKLFIFTNNYNNAVQKLSYVKTVRGAVAAICIFLHFYSSRCLTELDIVFFLYGRSQTIWHQMVRFCKHKLERIRGGGHILTETLSGHFPVRAMKRQDSQDSTLPSRGIPESVLIHII